MFKTYKTNGSNGEFIAQEVGELALGTYTYSFFTDGLVGQLTTLKVHQSLQSKNKADGGWDNVLVVDLAEGNTGAKVNGLKQLVHG